MAGKTKWIKDSGLQRAQEAIEKAGYRIDDTPETISGAVRPIVDAFNAAAGNYDIRRDSIRTWSTIGDVLRVIANERSELWRAMNQAVEAAGLPADCEMDDALDSLNDLLREAGEARATGQAESLRRHQEAIAALRRAIRLSRENGEPVSVFVLERVVQVAEHGATGEVDGEGDCEPQWRSIPIHDLKASKDQPEVFHGYSETEGGRVEISIQVAPDGTGTGTAVLPSGREVPMKNINPDLVALMKLGKVSVSIDGISISDQAHTADPCATCHVVESGRQECREAHRNTLCPEEQEERGNS